MNKYEILYIIDNRLSDEEKQNVIDRVNNIVTSNDGNILSEEKWGTKKFAYLINDQKEGYYVLMNFEGPVTLPEEINRQVRNMSETYRCMILKK